MWQGNGGRFGLSVLLPLVMVSGWALAEGSGDAESVDSQKLESVVEQADEEHDARESKVEEQGAAVNDPGEASYNIENCEVLLRADAEGTEAPAEVAKLDLDECRQWVK